MKTPSNPDTFKRIYSYGAKRPDRADLAKEALFQANQYQNKLIEIERRKRKIKNTILMRRFPHLFILEKAALQAQSDLRDFEEQYRKQNSSAKAVLKLDAENKKTHKLLKDKNKKAWDCFKEAKKQCYGSPSWKKVEDRLKRRVLNLENKVRENDLYWGTKGIVYQSTRKMYKGAPPRFKRFDGTGRLAVQFQNKKKANGLTTGLTTNKFIVDGTSDFQIVPNDGRHNPKNRPLNPDKWTIVQMRIGGEQKTPVYIQVPVRFDRPLPSDVYIKWAWLLCNKIGTHDKWEMQFVLESDSVEKYTKIRKNKTKPTQDACGIDVGWRLINKDRVRVAYCVGSDGGEVELSIKKTDTRSWFYADEIRSKRDIAFNEIKSQMQEWIKGNRANLSPCLIDVFKYMPQWRTPKQLWFALKTWRDNRVDGDDNMFNEIETWLKRDKKQYNTECNIRAKAIRRRDHLFHNFASSLKHKYKKVVLEDIDLAGLQKNPDIGEEKVSKKYQRIASDGRLLEIVKEKCNHQIVAAKNTSKMCNNCGNINNYEDKSLLMLSCSNCGAEYDRDRNAATNILNAANSVVSSAEVMVETADCSRAACRI